MLSIVTMKVNIRIAIGVLMVLSAFLVPALAATVQVDAPFCPQFQWYGNGNATGRAEKEVYLLPVGPVGPYGVYGWVTSSTESNADPIVRPTDWGDPTPSLGSSPMLHETFAVMNGGTGVPTLISSTRGFVALVQEIDGTSRVTTESFNDGWSFNLNLVEVPEIMNLPGKTSIVVEHFYFTLGGLLGPPDQPMIKSALSDPDTDGCSKGCKSCGGGAGGVEASLHSVDVSIGLGQVPGAEASGKILIQSVAPSAENFKLRSFGYDHAKLVPSTGNPSQIVGEASVVVISDTDPNDYNFLLSFYERDISLPLAWDGTYPIPNGVQPFATIQLDDPSPQSSTRSLRIRRTTSQGVQTWLYSWLSPTNELQLTSSTSSSSNSECLQISEDPLTHDKVETRRTLDAGGLVTSKTRSTYHTFPFGEKMISSIVDPDGRALATRWTYQESMVVNGYGKIRSTTTATGYWEFYEYDSIGRIVRTYSQVGNAVLPSYPNFASTNVEDWEYIEFSATTPNVPGRLAVIHYKEGKEISRSYRVADPNGYNDVQCVATGAAWDAPTNLVTKYRYSPDMDGKLRPLSVERPDGTKSLYSYEMRDDTNALTQDRNLAVAWIDRVETGVADAGTGAIVLGTRTETTTNRKGVTIESKSWDITSSIMIANSRIDSWDNQGRALLEANLLSGRTTQTSYNCCGVDSRKDEHGISTSYASTPSSNSASRLGVTVTTTQTGSTTISTRMGTDGTISEMSRSTTNLAGEPISAYSRGGGLVTQSMDVSNGYQRHTTTNEDGGTIIEFSYQDGSPYSIGGTAASPARYESGVQEVTEDGLTYNSRWSKTLALDSTGSATQEWTKTWTDMLGRTVKTETSFGAVTRSFYNSVGQLVKTTDADNVTTLYAYDSLGQLNVTALDMDRDGVIDYDGTDRITRTTRTFTTAHGTKVERTVQEVWATDGSDVPTTVTTSERSLDGLQSWTTQGTLVTQRIEQPGGNGWDGNWSVTTIYPDNSALKETYTNGRLSSQVRTDANNVVIGSTSIDYDAHGRVWRTTDGRGAVTEHTYEQQPNPVAGGYPVTADLVLTTRTPPKELGGTGPLTTFHYDAMGRTDLVTDALNGTTTTSYYPTGQVHATGGSRAYPVSYTYTPQGRLETMTTTTAAGPSVTTWIYHPTSGLLQEKQIAGATAYTQTHLPSGRLWTRTNARNVTTTYDYNNAGEIETIDYADATPDVSFTYWRQGQVKTTTSAGSTLTVTPNVFGQVENETWTGGDLDGVSLDHALDSQRRNGGLTVKRGGTTLVSHTIGYDDASRVKTITQGAATATYRYIDKTSLLDDVSYKQAGSTFATADHDYDLAGHLRWINYTNAANAPLLGSTYIVDDIHRRTKVTREDGTWWDWGYNPRSEVNSAFRKFADATPAPMEQFSYTFDDIGNRLTSTAAGRKTSYVPNTKNQYASRTNPGYIRVSGEANADANVSVNAFPPDGRKGMEFWRDVPVGNVGGGVLTPMRVIAAKPNGGPGGADIATIESGWRYVPPAAETFSHDDDGNLTNDARWTYTWDAENRLISAEEKGGAPAPVSRPPELPRLRLEFNYDATSRRTSKKALVRNVADTAWNLQTTTLFIWDGWNLVAELESGATGPVAVRRTYVWGLDISGSLSGTGGVGGLVFEAQYSTSSPYALSATLIPCYDGNGNVLGLTNTATGALDARYEYDAFGNVLRATGPAAKANLMRFSTKFAEVETGLVYYGFRYYSPELGRWLNRDPIEELGGVNVNQFCYNNAVAFVDDSGLLVQNPTPVAPTTSSSHHSPAAGSLPTGGGSGAFGNQSSTGSFGGASMLYGYEMYRREETTFYDVTDPKALMATAVNQLSSATKKVVEKMLRGECPCGKTKIESLHVNQQKQALGTFGRYNILDAQAGSDPSSDPPGWDAAVRAGSSVNRGHLWANRWGGRGIRANIVMMDEKFNQQGEWKHGFEEYTVPSRIASDPLGTICFAVIPIYRRESQSTDLRPAPKRFWVLLIDTTGKTYSNIFTQPTISGHTSGIFGRTVNLN